MSEDLFHDTEELVPDMDPRERMIRDQFVEQYLVDYNSVLAAIRVGFREAYAKVVGPAFLMEPYTQRALREAINKRKSVMADHEESEQSQIIEGLRREANYFGPGSSQAARVAALAHLAKLTNLQPAGSDGVNLHMQGGVMICPAQADPSDWQAAAMASQKKLQQNAGD